MKKIEIKNDYYPRDLIEKYHPEAYLVPTERIGSLPKNKAGRTIETEGNSGKYYAQVKKDGYSYSFEKTPNHSYLFSRNESKATGLPTEKGENVPHIMQALSVLPAGTILVGEIYYPGLTSKDVTTVMGSLKERAIELQKDNKIHYYIHDILAHGGYSFVHLKSRERYAKLVEILKAHKLVGTYSFIELAEVVEDTDLAKFAEECLAKGEEGIVMKLKDGVYSPGKRPAWNSIKVKKSDSVDVVCMGFEDATKEYSGKEETQYWVLEEQYPSIEDRTERWVEVERYAGKPKIVRSPKFRTIGVTKPYFYGWKTAIKIGLYKDGELVQIGTVSSGLTDELRADITKNPDKYLGTTIECDIMELGDGALRHPVFKKFRDDKGAKECTYESVFK